MTLPRCCADSRPQEKSSDTFPAVHRELELLVSQGGATPLEALQMATRNSARILGLDALVGTVEAGKMADLIVLEGNPLGSFGTSSGLNVSVRPMTCWGAWPR